MKHHKCLEFYLPWALTLFNLPKDLDIFIQEEHPKSDTIRGIFSSDFQYSYRCKNPSITLYFKRFDTVDDMMTTLFHELTHAQQYKEERLIDRNNPVETIWRDIPNQLGKIYPKQLCEESYWTLPWEVEAREVASKKCLEFMKRFKSINPFRKIFWWTFKPTGRKQFIIRSGRLVQ